MSSEPGPLGVGPDGVGPDGVGPDGVGPDGVGPDGVGPDSARIDWPHLRAAARSVMAHAYVPYSHFPVGAAALVDDGRVVVGCNVENASYGLGLCAECSLVSALYASGGGRLVAFTCVDGAGAVLMPCGRCRQLLWEHGGPTLVVDGVSGIVPMTEVLPDAFGAEQLLQRGEHA